MAQAAQGQPAAAPEPTEGQPPQDPDAQEAIRQLVQPLNQ